MSTPTIQSPPPVTPTEPRHGTGRSPRGRRMAAAVIVAALLVAAVALVLSDPFKSAGSGRGGAADNTSATSLATVTRRTLSSQDQVSGTLGYDGNYSILNNASGVFTRLPSAGDVLEPGRPLYWVDGKPIVLLFGHTAVYRALSEGMSGSDVKQLNADLVKLGYATRANIAVGSDYFSAATAVAVERLQDKAGVTETGSLALGDAVFEPGAMRIKTVTASLGGHAGPGSPVAQASATRRQVHISLDATQQASVRVGDHVDITLPDKSTTPGVVSSVGKVAASGNNGSTVDVYVRPLRPHDTGSLDEAPVQVAITTGTARHALVVPVNALLALASGGYAIEAVDARGGRRLIPVTTGLFDDADGVVQVEGPAVSAGQRVVVPAAS